MIVGPRITSATIAMLTIQAVVLAALCVVALDVYAHKRVEMLAGVNVWGYKGPVVHRRQPNEIRVAIVGGTRAFAWGQGALALSGEIRRHIMLTTDRPGGAVRPIVAINLARLGAMPQSYASTIEHFAYLAPDYICIYDDLGVRGAAVGPVPSGVFKLTGYEPALPLVLREKAEVLRRTGANRVSASLLDGAGGVFDRVDRVLASAVGARDDNASNPAGADAYVDAMMMAILTARRHARGVALVLSPAETAEQRLNLSALTARTRDVASASVRVTELGAEPRLLDPELRLDGWNYGGTALSLVAARVAGAVLQLISAEPDTR